MNDAIKKAYYRMFLDYFKKEKIDEKPDFWSYYEKTSKKNTIKCFAIDGIKFYIKYGDEIWGYIIGVSIIDENRINREFEIEQIIRIFNPIDYYKIKRTIKYMDNIEKIQINKKEAEFLINKLPLNYKRAMKIKSL